VSGEEGYQHATPSPLLFPILFPTFPLALRGAVQSTIYVLMLVVVAALVPQALN